MCILWHLWNDKAMLNDFKIHMFTASLTTFSEMSLSLPRIEPLSRIRPHATVNARRFVHVCRFECIYWTIWGRASKPRGDNFARRVAQLSASAKYVTLMVIIPLSLRLTVTSVTRNIALIPWCAQPLCDTYKCLTQMAQMRAARVRLARPARQVLEGHLNALVNAFGLFDQTDSSGTFIKRCIVH